MFVLELPLPPIHNGSGRGVEVMRLGTILNSISSEIMTNPHYEYNGILCTTHRVVYMSSAEVQMHVSLRTSVPALP